MNYRRPLLPWIVAASFFGESALFALFAIQGFGPSRGITWGVGSAVTALLEIVAIVMKLRHGDGPP